MPLPEYSQVRYARPPLRLVVCQVRFPSVLRIADPAFVANFQDAVAGEYPKFRREQQLGVQVSNMRLAETSHVMSYRFSDAEGLWSVLLAEDSLTLEAYAYSSSEDLLRRFEHVTAAARDTLGIETRQRLGLRYVNEFRHPEKTQLADWRDLFQPGFLGFAASVFDEPVGYALQQVQVQRQDGLFVVRHGVLRGTTIPPHPSLSPSDPQGAFYLLDLDYSDPRSVPLDVTSSREQLRAYNHFSYRFFRWTLSENHHAALEPHDAHRE